MTSTVPQSVRLARKSASIARRFATVCLLLATAAALPGWLSASAQLDRPPLLVSVEPSEGEFIVYEPVAGRSAYGRATGQIALLLKIENTGTRDIRMYKVRLTYSNAGGTRIVKEINTGLIIPKGGTVYWSQERIVPKENTKDNVVYLDEGFEPTILSVNLLCDGYDQPALVLKPLKPHSSPVAGGSYLFPAKTKDLRFGEYWQTSSLHGTSSYGSQLFAYDLGVTGWDEAGGRYWEGLPGAGMCTDGDASWVKKNEDYRIYGKPVYAMADGIVRYVRNNVPSNPMAWRLMGDPNTGCASASERAKAARCELPAGADASRFVGSGNHFVIQSGDELQQYAHLQPGSLNGNLHRGDPVKAGTFLGLVGNSGCSTAPHIHIDTLQIHDQTCINSVDNDKCRYNNPPNVVSLRPLIFHDLYTIDLGLLKGRDPNPSTWVKANDKAIPDVASAIWPSAQKPCFYPPEHGEVAFHGVSDAGFQDAYDRVAGCGYYPVWLDGFEANGHNYYNAVFRSASPPAALIVKAKVGLAELTDLRADLVEKQGYRIAFIDSYPSNGIIFFSCIFVKDGGPRTVVRPALNPAQHQEQLDALTKNGWKPIQVSAATMVGTRFITTLYEKRDTGRWLLKSLLTSREYNDLYNGPETRGMQLVHLNAYTYEGSPHFAAIWHERAPYTVRAAQHQLSKDEYQSSYNTNVGGGLLTRGVTGYERNNQMQFGAFWSN